VTATPLNSLSQLIAPGESERLELKRSTAQLRRPVEVWGRGTNRVIDACRARGSAPPEFTQVGAVVTVAFRAAVLPAADMVPSWDQVLAPLLDAGLIEMTIPDKPRSSKQRYRTTEAGRRRLRASHS
jgi:ATP-dependent DNA helicase RecG